MSYQTTIRLLNALPRSGAHSASAVRKLLKDDGGKPLTDRGVAKALKAIASAPGSPLREIHEGPGIATRWQWKDKHPLRSLAFRDAELLVQTLLYQTARRLIPPAIAGHLEHEGKWIPSDLKPDSQAFWWLQHVVNLPPGPPRFPKPLDEAVVQEVSKALWNRRQLQVDYRRRGARVGARQLIGGGRRRRRRGRGARSVRGARVGGRRAIRSRGGARDERERGGERCESSDHGPTLYTAFRGARRASDGGGGPRTRRGRGGRRARRGWTRRRPSRGSCRCSRSG